MGKLSNKWTRAAFPALCIHCSIGTVYCWSLLKGGIVEYLGGNADTIAKNTKLIEWAFSLAIFFLGMSAAFLGKIVEKDIHKSSLLAAIFFSVGMAGTGFFVWQKSIVGIFLSYGVVMGIGLGLGYLSPVKTLMLWFKDQKGLATGLAVAGFGAGKIIGAPVINSMLKAMPIYKMFFILAAVYLFVMFIGHLLLKKPDGWVEEHSTEKLEHPVKEFFSKFKIFKNKTFIGIWLMFYINITCGLALISQEKGIIVALGLTSYIALIPMITAGFNVVGRLGLSAAGDKLKDRNTIYKVIFGSCILVTLVAVLTSGIENKIIPIALILLFTVNAGYGGGFSNLPTLLSDHFGMKTISAVHGVALSAWAIAGLTGNNLATLVLSHVGKNEIVDVAGHKIVSNVVGCQSIMYLTLGLYVVAMIISFTLIGSAKKDKVDVEL